ncbi:MAG: TrkH family potassium uptake protein [Alphaproteobacteria bacterium]|nr:TrkH family potassium uptake protein [Alphaproteobacteria bacterium]
MHFGAIFRFISQFLLVLSAAMLIPLGADLLLNRAEWSVFALSAAGTAAVGLIGLGLFWQRKGQRLSLRGGFLLMTVTWLIIPMFAAIPLWLSNEVFSFTDALFESISGLSTTGATVLVGLDRMHEGLLLWRSILQWLGGIAIVLMAVVMLPKLGVGGMQIFRQEMIDRNEKALPRTAQVAVWIVGVYIGLSIANVAAYKLAGMSTFDAFNHAMTTIATGGFSTHDRSFAFYSNPNISWIAVMFMVLGSLPFILFVKGLRGAPKKILQDQQVQFFFGLLLTLIALMVFYLYLAKGWNLIDAVHLVSFNVTSIMTGTGYANAAYDRWGELAVPFFFSIMVIGGCAGSTSCGIKIFRFVVLKEAARVQLKRLLNPNGVFIAYYNGKLIDETISDSVQGFFLLFGVTFVIITWGLSLTGLDFLTAMSGAASAIANVGPGLGSMIGPEGNFTNLTDGAKWVMIAGMLVGRLEIYTVLLVLLPQFWND